MRYYGIKIIECKLSIYTHRTSEQLKEHFYNLLMFNTLALSVGLKQNIKFYKQLDSARYHVKYKSSIKQSLK